MRVPDLIFYLFFEKENNKIRKNVEDKYLEIVSGKKIQNPSDDPASTNQILNLKTELSKLSQFSRNRLFADTVLSYADTLLAGIEDRLKSLYSKVIQLSNQVHTPDQLKAAAKEFEEALKLLLNTANEKVGNNYIFSGNALTTKPFDENTLTYNGGNAEFEILIDEGYKSPVILNGGNIFDGIGGIGETYTVYEIEITGFDDTPDNDDTGFRVDSIEIRGDNLDEIIQKLKENFGDSMNIYLYEKSDGTPIIRLEANRDFTVTNINNTNPREIDTNSLLINRWNATRNIFETIKFIADELSEGRLLFSGPLISEDSNDYFSNNRPDYQVISKPFNKSTEVKLMEQSVERIINFRAKIGSILKELRNEQNYQEDRKLVLEKQKSEAEDADLAKSISEYERYRLAYDAIMKLFVNHKNMSILDYI
ncbi:flagellar hook-associated protein FlgL [Aquifex aeolicus]|uniref:Flagellar hook associated protein FlgL n=1 Tax=Aquifex aeolicus (strain VF5) TaxID=224324 RepID=O67579_AQUAE|nr:flagellar hook-associated protein FlgL [Aquifex aeolicus]AAC07524.1 flagellar hook associated protein FlgL [Aquifex aeolicus VF5]